MKTTPSPITEAIQSFARQATLLATLEHAYPQLGQHVHTIGDASPDENSVPDISFDGGNAESVQWALTMFGEDGWMTIGETDEQNFQTVTKKLPTARLTIWRAYQSDVSYRKPQAVNAALLTGREAGIALSEGDVKEA